mmetsp:Transcript_36021/g.113957  ORF Transcript_36021/g.113957 Transcript_36021/m.113957 type:complete len:137 (+) Transcript_36021:74-484(+)
MPPLSLYDSPPCDTRFVDGILRGTMLGGWWGLVMGYHDSGLDGKQGAARARYTARSAGRSGLLFGGWMGTYNGMHCYVERARGEDDWVNAGVAGVAAGGITAIARPSTRHPVAVLGTGLASGAITASIDHYMKANR